MKSAWTTRDGARWPDGQPEAEPERHTKDGKTNLNDEGGRSVRYAKLKDGAIEFAPRKIQMDGATVYNPVPDKLTALGYLPVVTSDPGEAPEGYYFEMGWAEQDGQIVQTWTPTALTEAEAADYEDALEDLGVIA